MTRIWCVTTDFRYYTNKVISMNTSITKSLLTSLFPKGGNKPLFSKEGRFFNNDALLMNFLVTIYGEDS
jgi:hypothetical protein